MGSIRIEEITTARQLLELPEDFGPCELVRGELTMMSPAGSLHGRIETRLMLRLGVFVEERRLGLVFPGDTGFFLEQDKDTVRSPDVAFVAAARIPPEMPKGFFPGAPDLAVEIRSPEDRFCELLAKISLFLQAGTRVVWDVAPDAKTVTIYRTTGIPEILSGDALLTEPDLLPGFSLPVQEIFAN